MLFPRAADPDTLGAQPASPRQVGSLTLAALLAAAAACATGGGLTATDEEWRALALPRPSPLDGAARVSVAEVQLVGDVAWPPGGGIAPELGLEELVVAGLLRRRDVHFVERRRFTAATNAERIGTPRPPAAPAAGISPGAEYVATAVWIEVSPGSGSVELRLADAESGRVVTSTRVAHAGPATPVAVARAMVVAILAALDGLGLLPVWEDPASAPDGTTRAPDVSHAELIAFLRGVVAENAWNWEGARRGYQAASEAPGFYEASAALARAARLRLGGTLGES